MAPAPATLSAGSLVKAIPAVLADAARLKNPVVDAGIVATILAIVSPFGMNVGTTGAYLSGALLAVGTLAAAVEKVLADIQQPTPKPKA